MKKFKTNDESFVCVNCNKKVSKLNYTSRDHCNWCLYSMHVDINPGDRKNKCMGLLKPIGIEKYRHTFKIVYKCDKCGMIKKNIMAKDDNMELIISLSKNPYKET